MANEQEFGRYVRARRKGRGVAPEELASVVPCSPRLLSEPERGERGVSIALTFRLPALLGVELSLRGREEGQE